MSPGAIRIAIAGATSAVGTELLRLMEARRIDARLVAVAASSRSAGRRVLFRGESFEVVDLEQLSFPWWCRPIRRRLVPDSPAGA